MFITTYHRQGSGKVERFNRAMLTALRSNIADYHKDWELYTDVFTYFYNIQIHRLRRIPF